MSSWYGGSQRYSAASSSDGEEQIDYTHRDPTLINSEIELEDLPPNAGIMINEEQRYHDDDDNDYEFAFQDFPRHDGTPCLIYNEESLLKEREARQRKIFVVDSNNNNTSDDSIDIVDDEKKSMDEDELTKPVSDQAFMNMLSQNSLAIDGEALTSSYEDVGDISMDSRANGSDPNLQTPQFGKSPKFQEQLSQLMQTKQRRYAMEHKKEDIMNQHRKNRKQAREQERRNRHKEMERELEDIEAEFFSPVDPNRRTR